jgi:hypothetical protein
VAGHEPQLNARGNLYVTEYVTIMPVSAQKQDVHCLARAVLAIEFAQNSLECFGFGLGEGVILVFAAESVLNDSNSRSGCGACGPKVLGQLVGVLRDELGGGVQE